MGIARKLEQRLEQIVDGLSAAIVRGQMDPLELTSRIVRQADLMVEDSGSGPTIANRFTVRINPRDLEPDADLAPVQTAVAMALDEQAAHRGWRTTGPMTVAITVDDTVASGSVQCAGEPAPGPRPVWGQLIDTGGTYAHALTDYRTLIGRSAEADIVIDEPHVSRLHAEIVRRDGAVFITDLASSNGTSVNGDRVADVPHALHPGDELVLGRERVLLRMV